jgi:hypothetical protein
MSPSPTAEDRSPGLRQTALALSLLQLALHAVAAFGARDPRVLLPHAVAWLHDLALLFVVAAVFSALARAGGRRVQIVVTIGGRMTLIGGGMLLALCPQMLPTFLAAPANFLETDAGTARVFLQDYLGVRALWPAVLALGVGIAAPRAAFLHVRRRWALAAIPLAALTLLTLGRESPNAVAFGLQDSIRQSFAPRTVPRIKPTAAAEPLALPAPVDWPRAASAAEFDHVLIVVLEGITSTEFETGFLTRPDGFYQHNRGRACWFSRCHTTNLDSYTSLIAMTTSIQVPFRAYAAPAQYRTVNDAPNIVRGLRTAGYRTLFISTYQHQPFVPNARDWDKILDRNDLGDLSRWASYGSNRMESATEDRAGLPAILAFVKSAPRSLVMAELVFGHSPEWRAKTGMTPLEYYDRYLTALADGLTAAQLAGRTLLVVVSDHGDRSRAAAPDNYRVPLLIVGDGVSPGEDRAFRSHLDLQALVAHFLVGSEAPPARQSVLAIGSTERWVYGEIRDNGEHAFVDDGAGRALAGALDMNSLRESFQAYVASFNAAFGTDRRSESGRR